MMNTIAKGRPYPTIRDLVMVVLGLANWIDLKSVNVHFNNKVVKCDYWKTTHHHIYRQAQLPLDIFLRNLISLPDLSEDTEAHYCHPKECRHKKVVNHATLIRRLIFKNINSNYAWSIPITPHTIDPNSNPNWSRIHSLLLWKWHYQSFENNRKPKGGITCKIASMRKAIKRDPAKFSISLLNILFFINAENYTLNPNDLRFQFYLSRINCKRRKSVQDIQQNNTKWCNRMFSK